MKVFCEDCRYLKAMWSKEHFIDLDCGLSDEFEDNPENFVCRFTEIEVPPKENFLTSGKVCGGNKTYENCSDKNKNNDCQDFEKTSFFRR